MIEYGMFLAGAFVVAVVTLMIGSLVLAVIWATLLGLLEMVCNAFNKRGLP